MRRSSSLLTAAAALTTTAMAMTAIPAGAADAPAPRATAGTQVPVFAGPLGGWLAARGGGRFALIAGGVVTVAGWLKQHRGNALPAVERITAQPQRGLQRLHAQGVAEFGRILDRHACALRQIGTHGVRRITQQR